MARSIWLVLAVALAASSPAAAAPAKATAKKIAYKQRSVLPFIEDDYTKALAQARARKTPIFIEAWAPW